MSAKTEELLYMMLWTAEIVSRPTFRNMTESFEGWAYRKGLLRQIQRLEKQQIIERKPDGATARLYRLTEAGRLQALGGRDPIRCWNRSWDGRWRMALFDVPESRHEMRHQLREYLRARGFGCLQGSVWVTPDPMKEERSLISKDPVDVESLILLDARPCAGETDVQIVEGAWDFAAINQRYAAHGAILERCPQTALTSQETARVLHRWLLEERTAWLRAIQSDPLLPTRLLPPGYAGRDAWQQRQEVMKRAGEQMRGFAVPPEPPRQIS